MTPHTPQRKVQCWIFSKTPEGNAQCLLLKTNEQRGAFWQPVTGTVEDHEGYFQAACREPVEETGFRFNEPPIDTGYEFDFTSRFGLARERVFALVVDDLPKPTLDPKEHQDSQWASPDDALKKLRFPSNIDGLKRSFKLIFGRDL